MTMKIEINNRWVMALLVLNLLVVAGFWVSSFQGKGEMGRRNGRGEGPKKEIIERLQFEDWQVEKYEGLIALHRKAVGERERKINALRQTLFEGVGSGMFEGVGSGMDSTETMQICKEMFGHRLGGEKMPRRR
ncbi:MAG: hypothetical protein RLZZ47_1605 [Bacteroidota bacterium]